MNRPRPRLIVHIGQHKTGSKALQSFLAANRAVLRAEGILYPAEPPSDHGIRAYSISHFRLFALLRREATADLLGAAAAGAFWERYGPFCRPFESARDFLADLDADRRRDRLDRVVVSAEDLSDMHSAHEAEFRPELVDAAARRLAALAAEFGYEPEVVIYLRRQDHLLGAHYVQFIKGSGQNAPDFADFASAFAPRLDARGLLDRWAAAFGRDRIRVRLYEKPALPAGIVPDFFAGVLGIAIPPSSVAPAADVESVNRSLGRDHVEFIRLLNRRAGSGRPDFDRGLVLETALRPDADAGGPTGIAGWLSPAARRDLLDSCADGNAAIARDYLGHPDGQLFAEPPPGDEPGWAPYPGLGPDRALDIALAVHDATLARRPAAEPPAPRPAVIVHPPGPAPAPSILARGFRRARRLVGPGPD